MNFNTPTARIRPVDPARLGRLQHAAVVAVVRCALAASGACLRAPLPGSAMHWGLIKAVVQYVSADQDQRLEGHG